MFPKKLALLREDNATPVEITVNQIPLKNYQAALDAVNSEDEFKLCAIACGCNENLVKALSPESYENVLVHVFEINKNGFFSYARRRQKSLAERAMIQQMAKEVMAQQLNSQSPPPGSPPRPA